MSKVSKVTITIDTTNDAFEDMFQYEVAKVLAQVEMIDGMKLRDSNGNTVGTVEIETE